MAGVERVPCNVPDNEAVDHESRLSEELLADDRRESLPPGVEAPLGKSGLGPWQIASGGPLLALVIEKQVAVGTKLWK